MLLFLVTDLPYRSKQCGAVQTTVPAPEQQLQAISDVCWMINFVVHGVSMAAIAAKLPVAGAWPLCLRQGELAPGIVVGVGQVESV